MSGATSSNVLRWKVTTNVFSRELGRALFGATSIELCRGEALVRSLTPVRMVERLTAEAAAKAETERL